MIENRKESLQEAAAVSSNEELSVLVLSENCKKVI